MLTSALVIVIDAGALQLSVAVTLDNAAGTASQFTVVSVGNVAISNTGFMLSRIYKLKKQESIFPLSSSAYNQTTVSIQAVKRVPKEGCCVIIMLEAAVQSSE